MQSFQSTLSSRAFGIVKALLAIGLVYWAVTSVDQRTWAALRVEDLRWTWIALAVAAGFLSVLGWATRWYLLLRAVGLDYRFGEIWRLTMIADFFNLYFLGPVGADGVRFAMLARRATGRRIALIGSLVLDHVMGLQALAMIFFAATLTQWSRMKELSAGQPWILWAAAAVIGGFGALSGSVLWPIGRHWLGVFFGMRHHGAWGQEANALMNQLQRQGGRLWASLGVSLLSLLSAYVAFVAAAKALRLEIPPWKLVGALPVIDAYAMLPFTVSGVGVREHLFLELFSRGGGCDPAKTVSVSLLGFVCLGLWGLLGGLMLTKLGRETENGSRNDESR